MEKVITKGEGEAAGQVDKNKMLFPTEILDDFWEVVLRPPFLGQSQAWISVELSCHPQPSKGSHVSFTAFAQL